MTILGIDIGGTTCSVVSAADDGTVQTCRSFPTSDVDGTLSRLQAVADDLDVGPEPVIGIACGGPLDAERGLILSPPNLPGWDAVPIVDVFEARYGGRAFLMNDANAGALAEWHFGAGRGLRHLAFLTFGTGIGAGLILDGRLYEGATGNAGELGHVRLTSDGPLGHGKAGSVEGWCSGSGIARLLHRRIADGHIRLPEASAKALASAASAGDPAALAIFTEVGRHLGEAIAILVDLLDLEAVILGSLYVRCQRWLEAGLRQGLEVEALAANRAAVRILPAALGEDLGPMQAIAIAVSHAGGFLDRAADATRLIGPAA